MVFNIILKCIFQKSLESKRVNWSELKKWFSVLSNERREEAIATFSYENVEREVFVLFKGDGGENYMIGLNEVSGDLKKGDSEVKINQEHRKVLEECLEKISSNREVLLDLSV